MDPVAHFHFGNGALLNTVHWRFDSSPTVKLKRRGDTGLVL